MAKFKRQYADDGSLVALFVTTNLTNEYIGSIIDLSGSFLFYPYVGFNRGISQDDLKAISDKVCRCNRPEKTPPPSGYYKCTECGVQVKIQAQLTYDEQSTCPNDNCLGHMRCNEYEGWNKKTC